MEKYMREALAEALKAREAGEIPIGAVVVFNNEVIARAHNTCEENADFTFHAELNALRLAAKKLGTPHLTGCELYTTLEPCAMCMGAIINSGVSKLVFGADDYTRGASGGMMNLSAHPDAKRLTVYGGILENECAAVLKEFFMLVRNDKCL